MDKAREQPSKEQRQKQETYLDKHIFYGLKDLNDGFDAKTIRYFSAADFEIALKRIKELGIAVYGIEPWKEGQFYGVVTYEEVTGDPADPDWYMKAFKDFEADGVALQYAASYWVPDDLLKQEGNS